LLLGLRLRLLNLWLGFGLRLLGLLLGLPTLATEFGSRLAHHVAQGALLVLGQAGGLTQFGGALHLLAKFVLAQFGRRTHRLQEGRHFI
jgi:hypothetical protein